MARLIMKLGIDVKAKDLNLNFKYFIESKEHDNGDIQRNKETPYSVRTCSLAIRRVEIGVYII